MDEDLIVFFVPWFFVTTLKVVHQHQGDDGLVGLECGTNVDPKGRFTVRGVHRQFTVIGVFA